MEPTKQMNYGQRKLPLALLALALLLSACDRSDELPANGQPLSVRIHSLSVTEERSKDLFRSGRQPEETVSIPLPDDNLLLEMAMERDAPTLRAGQKKELNPGALFRVIALEPGTSKYIAHGDFTVGGASTSPTFQIISGKQYDFLCISCNNANVPGGGYVKGVNLPTFYSNGSEDFLWWKKEKVMVNSAADAELSIELNQMLAKLKVSMDCSYNGWNITNVATSIYITSVATGGTINPGTGEVVSGLVTHYFKWPLKSPATQQLSEQVTIMPRPSSTLLVTVPANTVTRHGLSSVPSTLIYGRFTTAVQPGASYTLRVRFRTPIWAGSNIYWEGDANSGRLTFDPTGQTQNVGYQGVFFKFGSLVGISPALVNGDASFSSNLPLYVPDLQSSTNWKPSTAGAENYAKWENIPFMDDSYYANSGRGRDDAAVIDASQHNPGIHTGFRGDICQYLGAKDPRLAGYRLPTANEFGAVSSWSRHGSFISGNNTIGTPFGRTDLLSSANNRGYARNPAMGNVILPTSGFRHADGSLKATVGYDGYYWPASEHTAGEALIFEYYGGTINYPIRSLNRSYAFPIRCIKK